MVCTIFRFHFVLIIPLIHGHPLFVQTKKGPIAGFNKPADPSTTNVEYDAFLGIPYGDEPERFQLPKARTPWRDTLYTVADGSPCPQQSYTSTEDCLYLNVYTPPGASTQSRTSKLPVMVFIPGGAFISGSSSSQEYGPDFLISGGIILVTINYRVGAAGFLSLDSKVASGNLGLHDTLLALQWVQDEIAAFGGDSTQVTLAGQSAGAVITELLYISFLSIGMFHRAIAQSGSALARWSHVTGTEARRRGLLLAQRLNCDTSQNDTVILTCLQNADINDVVGNQSIPLPEYGIIIGNALPFVPVLDTDATADKPFFSNSLDNLMEAAVRRAKPLMSGFTTEDATIIFSMIPYHETESKLALFLPEGERTTDRVNMIHARYFNDSPTLNKVQGLVSLYTENLFAYPIVKVIRKFANFTYGYLFAYDGMWVPTFSPSRPNLFKMKFVGHGDDNMYLFYRGQSVELCRVNMKDVNMMHNMARWWTNFVKTGVPDYNWPTVSNEGYLVINSQSYFKTESQFEDQYYDFWASLEMGTNPNSSANYITTPVLIVLLTLSAIIRYFYL